MLRIYAIKQKVYNFLRWSQKYTGTDNIYLAKGGFWLTLGQVVSTIASFLLAVAFANLLDPITYGNYKYILSLVGILGIFGLTGIGTAATQTIARGLEGSFYAGFKTKIKWGALGSLIAMGGALYYFVRGNYLLPIPLLISAIFLPLMQASQIYGNFLAGKKLFNFQIKYHILIQIISVLILIAALFVTKNLFWLIAVYFVSNTFLNYFFYLLTKSKFQPNKKEDPQTLSYGKHLSLMGVFGTLASYFDRLIIFHYLGAVNLAIYSFAIAPPMEIKSLLFKSLSVLIFPKFAKRSIKEIDSILYKRLFQLFLIGLGMAIIYILLAPYLFKIFFPKYLDSIFFSRLFAITIIFMAQTSFLGSAFQSKPALVKKLYIGTMASGILLILLLWILGYFMGITGIILARIIYYIYGTSLGIFFWKRSAAGK